MRLQLTLDMPAYSGGVVHQVICEHPAKTLAEFGKVLNDLDFITLDELYKNRDTGVLHVEHQITINTRLIGKVKVYKDMVR